MIENINNAVHNIKIASSLLEYNKQLRKVELIPRVKQLIAEYEDSPSVDMASKICNLLRSENDHLEMEKVYNSTLFNTGVNVNGDIKTISDLYADLDEVLRNEC